MKLKWYGHSCFGMAFADGTTLVTDPFDEHVGYPLCTARADAALVSHGHSDHNFVQSLTGDPTVFDRIGEFYFRSLHITGLPSYHDDAQGTKRGRNVIFLIEGDGLRIAHLGDLGCEPSAQVMQKLERLDLMLIPIGGYYTIDTPEAVRLIARLKPATVVGMHFANEYCRFPISDETEFLRRTQGVRAGSELEILPGGARPSALVMEPAR